MKNPFVSLSFFNLFFFFARAENSKPNVLLVSIDDLNDWVGCLGGHPQAKTPISTDWRKWAPSSPTDIANLRMQSFLASMMTGRYPHATGIYFLSPDLELSLVLKEVLTLPEVFAQKGYKTMAAGKIFHRGDKRFFEEYLPTGGFGPRPKKRSPNLIYIHCGTGECIRMTITLCRT